MIFQVYSVDGGWGAKVSEGNYSGMVRDKVKLILLSNLWSGDWNGSSR